MMIMMIIYDHMIIMMIYFFSFFPRWRLSVGLLNGLLTYLLIMLQPLTCCIKM